MFASDIFCKDFLKFRLTDKRECGRLLIVYEFPIFQTISKKTDAIEIKRWHR